MRFHICSRLLSLRIIGLGEFKTDGLEFAGGLAYTLMGFLGLDT